MGSAGAQVQTSCQKTGETARGKGLQVHQNESRPFLSAVPLQVRESKGAPKARGRGAGASAARHIEPRTPCLPFALLERRHSAAPASSPGRIRAGRGSARP